MYLKKFHDEFTLEQSLDVVGLTREQFDKMTPAELVKFKHDLIWESHPDLVQNHGKDIDFGIINRAFDVLRHIGPRVVHAQGDGVPPWQPDKQAVKHKIEHESYRDANYIRKRLWELSGGSHEIFTIDAFGGQYFQGRIRAYGNAQVFAEMAQAMLVYNANGGDLQKSTRAVFVSSKSLPNTLLLVYADGKSYAGQPVAFKYSGKTAYNDAAFDKQIVAGLDRLKATVTRAEWKERVKRPKPEAQCELLTSTQD